MQVEFPGALGDEIRTNTWETLMFKGKTELEEPKKKSSKSWEKT